MGCEAAKNACSSVVGDICSSGAENYLGNNTARRLARQSAGGLYRSGESMIAAELKQRLNDRAEEFAHYLLPAGRKGVCAKTLDSWIAARRIPSVKIARSSDSFRMISKQFILASGKAENR